MHRRVRAPARQAAPYKPLCVRETYVCVALRHFTEALGIVGELLLARDKDGATILHSGWLKKKCRKNPFKGLDTVPLRRISLAALERAMHLRPGGLVNFSPQNERFDHPASVVIF